MISNRYIPLLLVCLNYKNISFKLNVFHVVNPLRGLTMHSLYTLQE